VLLQINARPDAPLIAAALRHTMRRPVLAARLGGWAMITVALFVDSPLKLILAVLGAIVAIGVPRFRIDTGARRAAATAGPTMYEITADGVANTDLTSRHAYAWTSFTGVTKLPGQLVFTLDRAHFLPVPTGSLSQWEIEEVLGAAANNGLQVSRG
jgi:hypothetical protein